MVKLMADSADKLVGQRIQTRRKEAGLTAADLAETIDISQQQLPAMNAERIRSILLI